MRISLLVGLALGCTLAGCTEPTAAGGSDVFRHRPGFSGLAHYRDDLFVAIHDAKRDDPTAVRLAIVEFTGDEVTGYRPLEVDWASVGGIAHDLEAIVAMPGEPGGYLVVESGSEDDHAGRAVQLRLSGDGPDDLRVAVRRSFELPEVKNVEGAALLPGPDGEPLLVLCERNERKVFADDSDAERFALLRWFALDEPADRLRPLALTKIHADEWPGKRGLRTCSDLFHDGRTLWLVSALDGERFDSLVYEVAAESPVRDRSARVRWRVADFKVEGLAAPRSPGRGLTIATDEDEAGGAVFVLPAAP